jgi:2-keto-3-deoxy-L-rhamnonate aldolase RhmA
MQETLRWAEGVAVESVTGIESFAGIVSVVGIVSVTVGIGNLTTSSFSHAKHAKMNESTRMIMYDDKFIALFTTQI